MLRLAILKLTSCSGCLNQAIIALLSSEDILSKYEVKYALELGFESQEEYDIVLVEGSVSTPRQESELKEFREKAKTLVALGTCAVQGGVQALRVGEDIGEVKKTVYPYPDKVDVYSEPKPIDEVVKVDFYIPGCPVEEEAVINLLRKYSIGGLPLVLQESVCSECKRRGLVCIMVSQGVPCMGPVTVGGCGALCPLFQRGCYGCYGLKTWDLNRSRLEKFLGRLSELGAHESMVQIALRGYGYNSLRRLRER